MPIGGHHIRHCGIEIQRVENFNTLQIRPRFALEDVLPRADILLDIVDHDAAVELLVAPALDLFADHVDAAATREVVAPVFDGYGVHDLPHLLGIDPQQVQRLLAHQAMQTGNGAQPIGILEIVQEIPELVLPTHARLRANGI